MTIKSENPIATMQKSRLMAVFSSTFAVDITRRTWLILAPYATH
jgi:hypothetical protein